MSQLKSVQKQLRRGTATEHAAFTGAAGEVTVDTTTNTLRVHDGVTAGGTALARQSDLDAADYVIATQLPTAENNYTWYRRYKSGWVEQGGRATTVNNVIFALTLPVTMASGDYSICLTTNSYGGSEHQGCIINLRRSVTPTATGFSLQTKNTGNTIYATTFYWEVKGIAAPAE